MYSLLVHTALYAPIGLIVWIFGDGRGGRSGPWISALVAVVTAFAMEALKLFLSGKKPDPTDVLIAAVAAAVAYVAATRLTYWSAADATPQKALAPGLAPQHEPRTSGMGVRGRGLVGGAVIGVIALVGWVIAVQPKEHFVDESKLPQLPLPGELPPVDLLGFKFVHPRLPSLDFHATEFT